MSKLYLEKLVLIVESLNLDKKLSNEIEIKHFFSGAALYYLKTICISYSPAGLAFKLPQPDIDRLIDKKMAKPLKYFPKGNVKKDYALFESPQNLKISEIKSYFIKTFKYINTKQRLI